MFHTLYVSLVRPHLAIYASEIWNLYLINKIHSYRLWERVQRCTILVPELRHLEYIDRLIAPNLPSLLYRRRQMDMITVFEIVHSQLEGVPFSTSFSFHSTTVTRGNGYKLYKQFGHLNLRKFSFFLPETINDWNKLPTFVIESPDVLIDI